MTDRILSSWHRGERERERGRGKKQTHLPLHSADDLRSRKNKATLEMNPCTNIFVFSVILLLGSSASNNDKNIIVREAYIHVFTPHGLNQTIERFTGLYGTRSLTNPVSGMLVHVQTADEGRHGCTDYNHTLPSHDWIALIERGQCMFTQKIRIATKLFNATGVIIYDLEGNDSLVHMKSRIDDEVYVFVTKNIGRRLALMVDTGSHVHVNITVAFPIYKSSTSINSSALSSFIVCIIAFLLSIG